MKIETDHLWGITNLPQIFTKKEDAEYFAEWMFKKFPRFPNEKKERYKVYEVYPDCFVGKLRNGYDTFQVGMKRDGETLFIKRVSALPTRFGFNTGRIIPANMLYDLHNREALKLEKGAKLIIYNCLAKDEEDAKKLCNEYRIKTFLDDIWFKKVNSIFGD